MAQQQRTSAPPHLGFRRATLDDHRLVVDMLRELVLELDSSPGATTTIQRLGQDIDHALRSDAICIELALVDQHTVGLSRSDIIDGGPIFRLRDDQRCGYIDQMYVRPAWRDSGVGQILLERCERWFETRGIKHCMLHAAPRAVRFYARSGYQPNREMFKYLAGPRA